MQTQVKKSYIDIEGRKKTFLNSVYPFLCISSLGFFYMACKYFPFLKIYVTTCVCPLQNADCVIIRNKYKKIEFRDVIVYQMKNPPSYLKRYTQNNIIRVVDTAYSRFIYDYLTSRFVIYNFVFDSRINFGTVYENRLRVSRSAELADLKEREILFGKNITRLPLRSIFEIIMDNTYSLSLLTNLICIILWFNIEYKVYGGVIGLMVLYDYIQQNISDIKYKWEMERSQTPIKARVLRGGKFVYVNSTEIYPGDLIYIEPCKEFFCDAVVIRGDVIADESFLTGECVPICKSSCVDNSCYDKDEYKCGNEYELGYNDSGNDLYNNYNYNAPSSTIYSGTSILKSVNDFVNSSNANLEKLCRVKNLTKKKSSFDAIGHNFKLYENYAIGLVTATGFKTTRGQIMKDIFNPKPVIVQFLREAYKTILYIITLSSFLSLILFFYFKYVLKWSLKDNLVYAFDLFFTMASPALSTSLSVGIRLSSMKLIKSGIICNNNDRIYISGNIETAVFDKTGTLTSEGMEFLCIDDLKKSINKIEMVDFMIRMGLSTCHSVYELEGRYSGDFLDVKMFIFSRAGLTQGKDSIRNVIMDYPTKLDGPILRDVEDETEIIFYTVKGEGDSSNIGDINNVNGFKDDRNDHMHIIDIENDNGFIGPEYTQPNTPSTLNQTFNTKPITQSTLENPNIHPSTNKPTTQNFSNTKIEIIKTYEFSSDLRRLSVIVRHKDKSFLFCKGAPDVIFQKLIFKPEDYEDKVREYSIAGYRVIAMAYREIEESLDRNGDEENLIFLCLIVFSNKLKPEAEGVISELKGANIKSVICTGDNILTAISVGRECNIVDNDISVIFPIVGDNCQSTYDVEWVCLGEEDLVFDKVRLNVYKNNYDDTCEDFVVACEGKEYDFFRTTDYYNFILEKGVIFARFTPEQKKRLIEDLRNRGEITMFCGDGANDSGALSSADIGLALAQNEASLASSFYTKSLGKVPILLKEGRSAYVTSIARFKFVCLSYILAYASLMFLVSRSLFLSDIQTLHIDIFIIVPFMYLISNFNRADVLAPKRPTSTILGKGDLLPLTFSMIFQILIIGFISIYGKNTSNVISEKSKAGTLVFFVTAFQSVFNGLFLSDCTPHRESISKNRKILIFGLIILFLNFLLLFLTYFSYDFVKDKLKFYLLTDITTKELIYILGSVGMSFVACFLLPKIMKRLVIE